MDKEEKVVINEKIAERNKLRFEGENKKEGLITPTKASTE